MTDGMPAAPAVAHRRGERDSVPAPLLTDEGRAFGDLTLAA